MDSRGREAGDEEPVAGTPEDVAVLYAWAHLQGAKYRDFSASRREYRAQVRYRAALALRERELVAQAAAEEAAATAERAAAVAEAAARTEETSESQTLRAHLLRNAEAATRKAAAERVEAARRAEAAAHAAETARREEQEIAEAHASAERQALRYTDSEVRLRQLAGPQPRGPIGDLNTALGDGAPGSNGARLQSVMPLGELARNGMVEAREIEEFVVGSVLTLRLPREAAPLKESRGQRSDDAPGMQQTERTASQIDADGAVLEAVAVDEEPAVLAESGVEPETPIESEPEPVTMGRAQEIVAAGDVAAGERESERSTLEQAAAEEADSELERAAPERDATAPEVETVGPAWLYASQPPVRRGVTQAISQTYGGETLLDSRERVAARWFALKGVFLQAGREPVAMQPVRTVDAGTPVLAVFSLAGGVGKTSLVATLGRALSSLGEKVVLTDTTSHVLLPFYFGARELRSGVLRTFSPPPGSTDAPIALVSYNLEGTSGDEAQQERLAEAILRSGQGHHRLVLDLSSGSGSSWLIRRLARLQPTVLVPMAPDMNSVISLQAVERFFQSVTDSEGRPLQPFYVLNQFDASLALHLDVREVFRRQLGDRLVRFAIRSSPAVSEALAEGMTVVDYAPDAPVSQDYLDVASWLRGISPPASAGLHSRRWSEQ